MKKIILNSIAALAVTLPIVVTATTPPTNEKNMSYAVGSSFAQGMIDSQLEVNFDSFITGLKDTLAGKTKFSKEETDVLLKTFDEKSRELAQAKSAAVAKSNKTKAELFLTENKESPNVKILPDGVQYEVLAASKAANNSPSIEDLVTVHYKGTLIDGTVFDSSYDRNSPAKFPIQNVIKGWQQVLTEMNVGDKWKVVIPPELAYGEAGAGAVIPPNSALIFEIELLGIDK
ncbi:MAG: FKBP-type peptidyl-prolyl cis-trans isomerase [Francisellaceae bacterium]|jgi:FKBP-type peptidyl-prolyl cis-trans isomerase FklB|nr:FKBP-type peptidyl-prolyl cis-trans isomerase [Francisellaceae bacterium]MBT6207654.1 FKBP-type peptidyl-prolyl cis-trans isomerase [Francisellaceae bacterium]MBT6538292.1 FKBP-type peptidyl-prolyl cis-trans isomerase [Francisellaceae bacterium]